MLPEWGLILRFAPKDKAPSDDRCRRAPHLGRRVGARRHRVIVLHGITNAYRTAGPNSLQKGGHRSFISAGRTSVCLTNIRIMERM
jgi:hypothetical protein